MENKKEFKARKYRSITINFSDVGKIDFDKNGKCLLTEGDKNIIDNLYPDVFNEPKEDNSPKVALKKNLSDHEKSILKKILLNNFSRFLSKKEIADIEDRIDTDFFNSELEDDKKKGQVNENEPKDKTLDQMKDLLLEECKNYILSKKDQIKDNELVSDIVNKIEVEINSNADRLSSNEFKEELHLLIDEEVNKIILENENKEAGSSTGNILDESTVAAVNKIKAITKIKDLKSLCDEYPEEEWGGFKTKEEFQDYLIQKVS